MFNPRCNPARFKGILPSLFAFVLFCSPGCSKDKMKEMAASVQEKSQSLADATKELATQAVEKVEEQLPETGEITLQVSPPVDIKSANIELISIGDGRENVIQISNYDVATKPTSYPSVLIRGKTAAGDPASLAGQTVSCELYMQASSSSPIAMTAADQPAQVTFRSFDPENKTVSANIARVALMSSDNKPVALGGGSIVAVVSEGGS